MGRTLERVSGPFSVGSTWAGLGWAGLGWAGAEVVRNPPKVSFILVVAPNLHMRLRLGLIASLSLVATRADAREHVSGVGPPSHARVAGDEEAFPKALELTWNAPEGCTDARAIEARIAALLNGASRGRGVARVRGEVERVATGVKMTMHTEYAGRVDVRVVESPSCGSLEEAAALLLAIALEPRLADEHLDAGLGATAEPTQVNVPPPRPDVTRGPEPLPPRPTRAPSVSVVSLEVDPPARSEEPPVPIALTLGVGAGGEWGLIRQPMLALRGDVGVAGDAWRIEAQGRYLAPRRRVEGDAAVLLQAGTAGLRGCWTPDVHWARLALCGGGEAGGMRAETRNVAPAGRRVGPLGGFNGALEVSRTLGAVELWGGVDAFVPVQANRVKVDGDLVFAPAPISPRLTVGVRFTGKKEQNPRRIPRRSGHS